MKEKSMKANCSIEDLGQVIISGISGLVLTKEEMEFLEKENIGGVILFDYNYQNPKQLALLINSIQQLRRERPFFICVDFEGGRVRRFKTHFTAWPSMQSIARLNSPKIIFEVHSMISTELKSVGINWNFAPVCDVLTNTTTTAIGDRSFGYDPENIGQLITAAIRGMIANKMISCAKHYPGHGPSEVDSHYGLPVIQKTFEELEQKDLIPFYKAAKSKVESIMVGHLLLPKIDPKDCASMSKKIIKHLRDSLRYNRIIISDDLQMHSITKTYGEAQVPIQGINAGNNVLIYRSLDKAKIAMESLKVAYDNKSLDHQMLQDSIAIINKTKDAYLSDYEEIDVMSSGDFSYVVGCKQHAEYHKDLLEKLSALGH